MSGAGAKHAVREFQLSGLNGISDATLETHFTLYAGYVKALNEVEERIASLGVAGDADAPAHLDLVRRHEFEQGGKILHELYFDNLERQGGEADAAGPFARLVAECFGGMDAWRSDFLRLTKTRGIGWVVTLFDPARRRVSNRWIPLHSLGSEAGAKPLLVMDLWEHAWLLDYKPADKSKHADAFFENVSWGMVDRRAAGCFGEASRETASDRLRT